MEFRVEQLYRDAGILRQELRVLFSPRTLVSLTEGFHTMEAGSLSFGGISYQPGHILGGYHGIRLVADPHANDWAGYVLSGDWDHPDMLRPFDHIIHQEMQRPPARSFSEMYENAAQDRMRETVEQERAASHIADRMRRYNENFPPLGVEPTARALKQSEKVRVRLDNIRREMKTCILDEPKKWRVLAEQEGRLHKEWMAAQRVEHDDMMKHGEKAAAS